MAITDPGSVKLSYLDMVQLEQSGAGLPAHAGKEAALYDGSGAQILGRTAVRHWLDPHPDAASFDETWEFSTTGDMTQGELETAGWTFVNCTGAVSGGALWLTASSAAITMAYLTVSLSGDFDIVCAPVAPMGYNSQTMKAGYVGGLGVGYTGGDAHYCMCGWGATSDRGLKLSYTQGALASLGGTGALTSFYTVPMMTRISRVSGTNYLTTGAESAASVLLSDDTTHVDRGWFTPHTKADAATFDRLFLVGSNGNAVSGGQFGVRFLRRFQ